VQAFVANLPLRKIPGVGPVTEQRLADRGLLTTADCRAKSLAELIMVAGKFGEVLWQRSHGIDLRPVDVTRIRRSVGVETTLSCDIAAFEQCCEVAESLLPELQHRLIKYDPQQRIQKQGVKLKFDDFQQTTVEQTSSVLHQDLFVELLSKAYARASGRGIRLVGLNVALGESSDRSQQLQFQW
jgi:DNA polymerase-4